MAAAGGDPKAEGAEFCLLFVCKKHLVSNSEIRDPLEPWLCQGSPPGMPLSHA